MGKADYTKYKNVILYLCSKLGGQVKGKKKLFKLLYYVDFDMFEYKESMQTITGTTYSAWRMGPVPEQTAFRKVIQSLEDENKLIVHFEQVDSPELLSPMNIYTAKEGPQENVFSDDERFILDRVISHYGRLSGLQLEALTHQEAPWIGTDQSGIMPFEMAFYRGTDFNDAA